MKFASRLVLIAIALVGIAGLAEGIDYARNPAYGLPADDGWNTKYERQMRARCPRNPNLDAIIAKSQRS